MRGLTFFDPNQIHLDQRSSELLCIKDRLLLGQAKNLNPYKVILLFFWHGKL
jgi:hypothetical protein